MIEWILFQIIGVEWTIIGLGTKLFTISFGSCVCQHVDYILVHVTNSICSTCSVALHILGDAVGAVNSILACFERQANVWEWLCRGVEVGNVGTILLVFTNLSAFFFWIDLGDRINEIILIIVTLSPLSRAGRGTLEAIAIGNRNQQQKGDHSDRELFHCDNVNTLN